MATPFEEPLICSGCGIVVDGSRTGSNALAIVIVVLLALAGAGVVVWLKMKG